ncbi:MAG: C-GCAxxG-C-C family (seleno)protein [Candidatus Heimdallarchaeaceae archaeon]
MEEIKERAFNYWNNGQNCARSSASGLLDYYGYNEESKILNAAFLPYGGGVGERSLCGALLGGLAGLSFILRKKGIQEELITEKIEEFKKNFEEQMGSLYCGEIIGAFLTPEGELKDDSPQRRSICDNSVATAVIVAKKITDKLI